MEFDLKVFFQDPPRIRDEVKKHIYNISTKFVERVITHVRVLDIERVLPRHLRLVLFNIVPDPQTRVTRNGLCSQKSRIKSISKIFQSAMDATEKHLQGDAKYGGISKQIVKSTHVQFDTHNVKASNTTIVLLSACISEICGIMLNTTLQEMGSQRTMTIDMLLNNCTVHTISNGEKCVNASLSRLLHVLQRPHPQTRTKQEAEPDVLQRKRKLETRVHEPTKLEEKKVSFSQNEKPSRAARPSTPDTCFWEED